MKSYINYGHESFLFLKSLPFDKVVCIVPVSFRQHFPSFKVTGYFVDFCSRLIMPVVVRIMIMFLVKIVFPYLNEWSLICVLFVLNILF